MAAVTLRSFTPFCSLDAEFKNQDFKVEFFCGSIRARKPDTVQSH